MGSSAPPTHKSYFTPCYATPPSIPFSSSSTCSSFLQKGVGKVLAWCVSLYYAHHPAPPSSDSVHNRTALHCTALPHFLSSSSKNWGKTAQMSGWRWREDVVTFTAVEFVWSAVAAVVVTIAKPRLLNASRNCSGRRRRSCSSWMATDAVAGWLAASDFILSLKTVVITIAHLSTITTTTTIISQLIGLIINKFRNYPWNGNAGALASVAIWCRGLLQLLNGNDVRVL